MFSMTLICMGKLKEKFYIQASEEYKKRLGAFCDFTLLELPEVRLPENPNETQILQGLSKEAELIRAKVPKGSWLCIFAPEGKLLSSEELAGKLSELKKSGKSSVCFLIGSSFGVDAGLKKQADLLLSMSRMTFPHHLARVMALEQLYRAEAIQAGTKYHKSALVYSGYTAFESLLLGSSAQFILSKRPFSVKIKPSTAKNCSACAGSSEFSGKGC